MKQAGGRRTAGLGGSVPRVKPSKHPSSPCEAETKQHSLPWVKWEMQAQVTGLPVEQLVSCQERCHGANLPVIWKREMSSSLVTHPVSQDCAGGGVKGAVPGGFL